jgi:hypothetical protein
VDDSPDSEYDPADYIASQRWVHARSVPPPHEHEYVVASASTDLDAHWALLRWIARTGRWEHFEGYGPRDPGVRAGRWKYARCGEWVLWASGPKGSIANRRRAGAPAPPPPFTQLTLDGTDE